MRVRMDLALVAVEVIVPLRHLSLRMRMCVVSVVVAMGVQVLERLVHVAVAVLAAQDQGDGGKEHRRGHPVREPERLAEQPERERGAHERRAREDRLSSCRAELLGRADQERDAGAVGQSADAERQRGDARPSA